MSTRTVVLSCAAALVVALTGCASGTSADYVTPSSSTSARASAAPPVSPTATGSAPVGGVGPVGAKWDWGRFTSFEPYVTRLSGGSTFYELVWCQVEERRGERNWRTIDRIVRQADKAGVDLMLKIRVGQCWATGREAQFVRGNKAKTESGVPTSEQEYSGFVTELVRRYSRSVTVWAVENEVNSPSFWGGTVPQYERLVALAARTIRSVDGSATVVDAGLSSTSYGVGIARRLLEAGDDKAAVDAWNAYYARRFGTRGEQLPKASDAASLRTALEGEQQQRNREYLAATTRLLASGVVDVRQVHFYEDASVAPRLVEYIRATTPGRVPVELWEAGSFVRGAELPEGEQVADMVEKTAVFLGAGWRKVIWLPLIPNPEGRNSDEPRTGLLDANATVRPLGEVYARLAADAREAKAEAVVRGGVRGVAFTRGGRTVAYLWSTGAPVTPGASTTVEALVRGEPVPSTVGTNPVRVTGATSAAALWED
ncbi:MAG: hypothetical protein ACRCYX_03920 [Dermatophilaceae bacterium]